MNGARGEGRTHTGRGLKPLPLPIGLPAHGGKVWFRSTPRRFRFTVGMQEPPAFPSLGGPPEIRTPTAQFLRLSPLPVGLEGHNDGGACRNRTEWPKAHEPLSRRSLATNQQHVPLWRRVKESNPQMSLDWPGFRDRFASYAPPAKDGRAKSTRQYRNERLDEEMSQRRFMTETLL